MKQEKRYLVVYDVSNDGNRTRLASKLLDYGDRVQRSVFEITLTPKEFMNLMFYIRPYIRDTDNLRVYSLCANCETPVCALGPSPPPVEKTVVI